MPAMRSSEDRLTTDFLQTDTVAETLLELSGPEEDEDEEDEDEDDEEDEDDDE